MRYSILKRLYVGLRKNNGLFLFIVFTFFFHFPLMSSNVQPILLPEKTVTVFKLEISAPAGDPLANGSPINQISFKGPTGKAEFDVEARVIPLSLRDKISNNITWTFESIPAGTALSWSSHIPGNNSIGTGVTAKGTMTGYPISNNEFGVRKIKMQLIEDQKVLLERSADLAFFFERDAVANGFTTPNWFRYWLEAIGGYSNVEYGGPSPIIEGKFISGITPAMLKWSYDGILNKSRVVIFDSAKDEDINLMCLRRGELTTFGIDSFENTLVHENVHVSQIQRADQSLTSRVGPWKNGWSWLTTNPDFPITKDEFKQRNNHYDFGNDRKPGRAKYDDDHNGIEDDLAEDNGAGELGFYDDGFLFDIIDPTRDWPLAFGPPPYECRDIGNPIEIEAYKASPYNNGQRRNVDWSDTGPQHY